MLQEATRRDRFDLDLLRRFRVDHDLHARELLATRSMPLVRSIVRRYLNCGQDLEDVQQAGLLGLAKAMDRYDLENGRRFITFAVPNIQGEIRRFFRDQTWAVHVPRSVQELEGKIRQADREHEQRASGPLSDVELADRLDATVEQVTEARAAGRCYRSLSLDQPITETFTIGDRQGSRERGYSQVEADVLCQDALGALPAWERQIVRWRFDDGLLQREIAERIGVSQMQVSRILTRALGRMHDHLEGGSPRPQAA